jgi:hypothetical protein
MNDGRKKSTVTFRPFRRIEESQKWSKVNRAEAKASTDT